MKKTLKVDEDLNVKLIEIKYKNKLKSINETIRFILNKLKGVKL
jgi:hypothetical protein